VLSSATLKAGERYWISGRQIELAYNRPCWLPHVMTILKFQRINYYIFLVVLTVLHSVVFQIFDKVRVQWKQRLTTCSARAVGANFFEWKHRGLLVMSRFVAKGGLTNNVRAFPPHSRTPGTTRCAMAWICPSQDNWVPANTHSITKLNENGNLCLHGVRKFWYAVCYSAQVAGTFIKDSCCLPYL
jgi:hypothetical protein